MAAVKLTVMEFVRTMMLGFYVLGGEWLWIGRKLVARMTHQDAARLTAWRQAQITRRQRLFSLENA